jgi:hypothetical protein
VGLQMPRRHELHILKNYFRDTSDHRSPHRALLWVTMVDRSPVVVFRCLVALLTRMI